MTLPWMATLPRPKGSRKETLPGASREISEVEPQDIAPMLPEIPDLSAVMNMMPDRRSHHGRHTSAPFELPVFAPNEGNMRTEGKVKNRDKRVSRKDHLRAKQVSFEAEAGHALQVLELLQVGASPDYKDLKGRTPCHLAAMNNHKEAVIALTNSSQTAYTVFDITTSANDGSKALHHAAYNGAVDAAKALLDEHRRRIQKARFDIRDVHVGKKAACKKALENKKRDLQSNTVALDKAENELKKLREQESELSIAIKGLETEFAAQEQAQQEQLAQLQSELGVEIESQTHLKERQEYWTAISHTKATAYRDALLESEEKSNRIQLGINNLSEHIEEGSKEYAKKMRTLTRNLMKCSNDLESTDAEVKELSESKANALKGFESALIKLREQESFLMDYSRKVVCKVLNSGHVEFNQTLHLRCDKDNSTPLHWAVDSGQIQTTLLLLGHGADPNASDFDGMTPLHWAALRRRNPGVIRVPKFGDDHLEVVVILLQNRAEPNAADAHKFTPLHYAASKGYTAIVRVLKEWGASETARSKFGATPMHYAMAQGHFETALALLDGTKDVFGAVYVEDDNGMHALHHANANGHHQIANDVLLHCNRLQEALLDETQRIARLGLRDEVHKTVAQAVGAFVLTGSVLEETSYYYTKEALKKTRSSGWSRTELLHDQPTDNPSQTFSMSLLSTASLIGLGDMLDSEEQA